MRDSKEGRKHGPQDIKPTLPQAVSEPLLLQSHPCVSRLVGLWREIREQGKLRKNEEAQAKGEIHGNRLGRVAASGHAAAQILRNGVSKSENSLRHHTVALHPLLGDPAYNR